MESDARPAQLPLPGGRPGATVRLAVLVTGERRPKGRLGRGAGDWTPITAVLVEHPGAGTLLVDCGLHPSVAHEPAQLGRSVTRRIETRMERDQALDEQLRGRGTTVDAVRVVVMTHLHAEQASGASLFPEATFVLDRREWTAAAAGEPGYHARHVDFPFDWRAIDYDDPSIDAFETFGRAADLFGDGSVRLLATPGHSPGHQSVLLRLAGGREALLCGDAAVTRAELDGGDPPGERPGDEHLHRRSRSELRRFAELTPGALVIPGREPPPASPRR